MLEEKVYKKIKYYTYSLDNKKDLPVILHIHGAGSRGDDLQIAIDGNPLLRFAKTQQDFPFKIIAPQCYADTWFDIYEQLNDFIDFVMENEVADKKQVSLTGISMGGYTAWQLLMSRPTTFKKAIICCGGGMYWNAERIQVPIRAFHGKLDDDVFYEESVKMANVANKHRKLVDLTLYEDLGHNCWDRAYSDMDNYKWLLED